MECLMNMKILTVTGCKHMELSIFSEEDPRIEFIKKAIEKRLISFIEEGLEWVLISGQMGVEMWTAEVVLDLKETYDIQVGVIPPFENQESRDRKSTRLNSSHVAISYAVLCLKKYMGMVFLSSVY